jgi:hypothetical protein
VAAAQRVRANQRHHLAARAGEQDAGMQGK